MMAEILATGDEIRCGTLVDSNSAHIARALEELGVEVSRHHCVGDAIPVLSQTLLEMAERADIGVVTGGLGPTGDDLSADAAAHAAGVPLKLNQTALADVRAFFENRGRKMPASNRAQAMLPQGAEILKNPVGTAPGFYMGLKNCHLFFMPGVPFEMKTMLAEQVLPRIAALKGEDGAFSTVRAISLFGLTESGTDDRLAGLARTFADLKIGFRAHFPVIQVRLYGRSRDQAELLARLDQAEDWVTRRLGNKVFSTDGRSLAAVVGDGLREKGASLALAESCTGGLIASLITDLPGSSDYFLLSAVTYANSAKQRLLGVSPGTLARYGAVSEETVKQMAAGVREMAGATYGLATSGIAGPSGGTADKPVGTVWIGLATPDTVWARRFGYPFERSRNKRVFAYTALDCLRRELQGLR